MTDTVSPDTPDQVRDAVAWAVESATPLNVQGHGSKRRLGRPTNIGTTLDLSKLSGIVEYLPAELILTARAGTPLSEIQAALAEKNQQLAFEPPDLNPLLGVSDGRGTVGGLVATNFAGPRRVAQGAVRDHFLGCQAVGGRAELFKAGGKVVKNVTGFDLCKLLAGSWGTLSVLTEVTLKVLPAPEDTRTVVVRGLSDRDAARAMSTALQSSHEVSAAAHLPAELAPLALDGAGEAATLIRVEGPGPSVDWRAKALCRELAGFGATEEIGRDASLAVWAAVRDVRPLVEPADRAVWRLSVPPMKGAAVVESLRAHGRPTAFYDWGGGLVWLSLEGPEPAGAAELIRAAVAHNGGGHATLLRATEEVRGAVPVFQPQAAPLAALSRRMKENFDPARVLNPGRMAEGL